MGLLTSCATPDVDNVPAPLAEQVLRFSELNPDGKLPKAWQAWIITPQKNKTSYTLTKHHGKTVLHADADAAASGLVLPLKPRSADQQMLSWEWKALSYIPGADHKEPGKDDAPLRIIVAFDGDKTKLSLKEQMVFEMAKIVSGQDMPYASIMYVWAANSPVETVITSARTSRIKMIVVNSGAAQLNSWQKHERDVAADYRRVFQEEPGKIIGIGLLTDSDNTRTQVQGIYGDIELVRKKPK